MRIGLLAGRTFNEHNLRVLQPILADGDFEVGLVVVDSRPSKGAGRKLIDHIRKGRGGYVVVQTLQKCFAKPVRGMSVEEFCRVNGIARLETARPYAPQTSAEIRRHNLDLLVLVDGFGIIREPLLSVCPKGILSYHHGDMRKYRGMPPGLWELYNGEKEIGITVQKIAAGLDCGVPVEEKHIPIYPNDTLATLTAKLKTEDQGMLHAALKKMANPDFTPAPLREFGKVYTLPNLRQWIILYTRIARRRLRCELLSRSAENP
jgi:folate-dependent phosphoribosylglycinamide formyltransferase PurN